MSSVHQLSSDLPALGRFDQFRKRARLVNDLRSDAINVERSSLEAQQSWLQRHEAIAPLVASLTRDLAILQRSATRTEIVDALVQLDALPSSKSAGAGAKAMMAHRIGAQEPTFGGINLAVLDVIDREDWLPAPSKVIRALADAEVSLSNISHGLAHLPVWHRIIASALAESQRQQAFESQRQAARLEHLRGLQEPPA